ncbi:MAG: YdeI/OmpD-associated family protein [Luteimonas sp.]
MANELPIHLQARHFRNAATLEKWLVSCGDSTGVWLKLAKKNAGGVSVSYAEALDVALCHGWIDSQKRSFDDVFFLQRFTPRRPKGVWSRINIGHVERLIAAGRLQAGGLREVEMAKADGRWEAAYAGAAQMTVPDELASALANNPRAQAFFDTLDKTNRYAVCWRVVTAKTPEMRAARVAKFVAMLAKGEKLHG